MKMLARSTNNSARWSCPAYGASTRKEARGVTALNLEERRRLADLKREIAKVKRPRSKQIAE